MSKASDFLLGKVSSSDENDEVIQPNTTDITGDSAWKYIDAGDISGFADWTNRNMNYRDIPFLGQIVGHTADAATQGIADAAQFVGADGVSNYLNEKAQEGENYLPPMATPELSLDYVTDPNGLASATGMLVGSMLSMAPATMLVPESAALKVGSLLKGLPKIGTVASEFAPKAVKWAATGPVEAAMEGGNTERQMLQNGATPEEAKRAAWNDFYGNVGLLTATNALEGGLLGKVARVKTPTFQNGLLNTASKIAGYAPATAAEAALQGYEEGAQQGIQEGAMDGQMDMNHILNPNAWDDEQWENAKFAVAGGLPLVGGSALIRRVGGRGNNATDSAEDLIAQAEASTQAKLAHDSAQAQTAEQATAQPAFAVVEQPQESASTDFDAGTYDMPTQGDAITAQVQNLKSGWQSVLPQIGGVLHNQFGLDGVISSAARTPEHNAEVGGAEHSHHIDNGDGGDAVDIVLPDGTTAEQAEQVKQYFENSGAFQEVLFHDAGSGYHLHLGGLKGSLGDAGASAGGGLTLSSGDEQIDAWIQEAADANGVPANLLSALLDVESGYNVDTPNSEKGAIGIAQFMPGTADAMGIDPRDPHQAIDGAARLLKQEYDHYGNWSQALEAYNGGEGNVGSGQTQAYAQKVLGKAGDISHVGSGSRKGSSTNLMNERPSFDLDSDDSASRKMIADFIDSWSNRAGVDDMNDIESMLDANGRFKNTKENRDAVREKWGDELQAYADAHMTDEQQQASRTAQMQQQDAASARKAAQPSKKLANKDNTQPTIEVNTPNLDAAKQQTVSATSQPQAIAPDDIGTTETPNANAQAITPAASQPTQLSQQSATQTNTAAQTAQPTQAAPIEQAKAPTVQPNAATAQNSAVSAQNSAQPQTPAMDAQQAVKQDNTLPNAQAPQASAQAQAQQRARAAKEQRLQKELETNATIDQIERGQQLEAAAKQNGVPLPKGMAGSLHRGQAPAIAQATELLQQKGVSLPTVEASENTVYGKAETGRGSSAQTPRKQLTTKASYSDKSGGRRGSLNGDKVTVWDGSKGGVPKKEMNFAMTLGEIEKALSSYGNGMAGLRKLVKDRYDAAVERWIKETKNPDVREKRRHFWENDMQTMKGSPAYDHAVDSYTRVAANLYEKATGQKAESPFERRMRERANTKSAGAKDVAETENNSQTTESEAAHGSDAPQADTATTNAEAMAWVDAHPFRYDKNKSVDENIERGEAYARAFIKQFGTTDQIDTPERQALRERIADELYGKGAKKKEGKVWLIVGVPASGKSTIANPIQEKNGAMLIDADEAKEKLPEFAGGLLAGAVHEESSNIVSDVLKHAMEQKDNIVMPVVGKTYESLKHKIDRFKEAGYEVHLEYVDLPVEKATQRVKSRFVETGRLVSPKYLASVGLKPKENYDKLKVTEEVDSYEAWNNDVERGAAPLLIERSSQSKPQNSSRLGGRRDDGRSVRQGVGLRDRESEAEASNRVKPNTESRSDDQGGFSLAHLAEKAPVGGAVGKAVTVVTDKKTELHARYRIVPASALTTSNVYDGDTIARNGDYPQPLQPRERSGRKEMQVQTDGMAADLHPADLEASRNLNQGAPLIRKDGVVLNGNGRTMAITRAYQLRNASGKAYTRYLCEHAEDFGFTKAQMQAAVKAHGTDKPVLVRELLDDVDDATMKDIITSKVGGASMSASEQATTDADAIEASDFDGYDVESGGDLAKASNDDFVARLLRKLADPDERNRYTDKNGGINQDGYQRVKRAIFSRAYHDADLIAKMAESMDDAIKNISNGLQAAAANIARLNLKMHEEHAYNYPLAKTIAQAVKKYNAIKEGKAEANVEAYANENATSLTGGDPEAVVKLVQALDDYHRSGKKVGIFLNRLARLIDGMGSPKEDENALFVGGEAEPRTLAALIDRAKELTDTKGEQNLFGTPKYSIAYHGTAADFDKFDVGQIGTGEGSQAHGWGLYFAKDRSVSEGYKSLLVSQVDEVKINSETYHREHRDYAPDAILDSHGKEVTDDGLRIAAGQLLWNNGDKAKALKTLEEYSDLDGYKDAANILRTGDVAAVEKKGTLAEVEVPEDDVMLDEQKTLDKQPETVREALSKLAITDKTLTGKDAYEKLSRMFISPRGASRALNKLGVKGIKYHGENDGDCYVVFDDKAVSIIRKLSASRAKEAHARSVAELRREIASAFPGVKNVRELDDGGVAFTMPNGARMEIRLPDSIELSPEEEARARRDHGAKDGVSITVNGYEVTVGKDTLIALAKNGERGTVYHEVLHVAMEALFNAREKAALAKKFGKGRGDVEERIAEAYRRYKIARERGEHVPFGKLFRRIQDFFANLADHYKELRGTLTDADIARRAFRELANGKAWERGATDGRGTKRFAGGHGHEAQQNRAANADENPVDNGNEQADNEGERKLRKSLIEKMTDASFVHHVNDRMTVEQIRELLLTQDLQHKDSLVRRFEDIERKAKIFHMTEEDAKKLTDSVRKVLKDALRIINAKRRLFNEPEVRGQLEQALRSADKIGSGSRLEKSLSDRRGGAPRLDAGRPDERLAAELVPGEHKRVSHPIEEEIQKELTEENHGQHYSISRSDSQDGFSRAKNPRKFAGEANADENPVDNRNGQNDNEGEERARFIDRLLNEKVPENGRTSIDSDVKDGIARFGKEITPENVEDVFDSLHCVRMLRATFNDNGRMQNYANGLDYAQKMAAYMYGYARRCFENDERIKRQLALRGTSVGRPAEVRDAHAESRPGRADEGAPRNGGQTLQGTSLAKHGNVKALQELYDRLVDEAYHGKQYSVSRSEPQDGFSRAKTPRKYSIAYHGTQHEFDKFDVGKIGSGEGSQVHGWGLYFAKDRKVSEEYRKELSFGQSVKIAGKSYRLDNYAAIVDENGDKATGATALAFTSLNVRGTKEAAIQDLASRKQNAEVREAIDLLKRNDTQIHDAGMLAEVEIPEDDVMLDEQKPFDEQPEKVKEALDSLRGLVDERANEEFKNNVANFLDEIERTAGKRARSLVDAYIATDEGANGKLKESMAARSKMEEELSSRVGSHEIARIEVKIHSLFRNRLEIPPFSTMEGWEIYQKLSAAFDSPRNASLALKNAGVKGIKYHGGRDGDCYVVFDDKAVSIIRKLSAERAKAAEVRAKEDLKREILRAFPGAKDLRDDGDRMTFTMPNGARVEIRLHDSMHLSPEEAARARKEHGLKDGVTITVNGAEYTLNGKAFIELSKRGKVGTIYHEALHAAMDLVLTKKEKDALLSRYGSEEAAADAYRDFMVKLARDEHAPFGKLWRKIHAAIRAIADHIWGITHSMDDMRTARRALEALSTGEAWGATPRKKSHGFSLFSHAEAAERPIDNEAARGDNEGKEIPLTNNIKVNKDGSISVALKYPPKKGETPTERIKRRKKEVRDIDASLVNAGKRSAYVNILSQRSRDIIDARVRKGEDRHDIIKEYLLKYNKILANYSEGMPEGNVIGLLVNLKGAMYYAGTYSNDLTRGNGRDAGASSGRNADSGRMDGRTQQSAEEGTVTHEKKNSVSRSERQDGFSDARKSDEEYLAAVDRYENAKTDEERAHALDDLRTMVQEAADAAGFHDAVPEQTVAYHTREGAAPKKTIKVYKVFTVSPDGSPTALFIGGTEKLPQGVWLDAQSAYHFQAANGKYYVPSTQNPYTKGGKTGVSVEIPNEQVRQELIERGFLKPGSTAKKITALAYRPGWHAGTLPFFPQGGKKDASANYGMVHRENQVVFECELAADKNYTQEARSQEKAKTKAGKLNLKNADLQYMPENGFYFYATNPLTQAHPELGAWAISGSLKINRALSQEECDTILKKNGMEPQAWEQGDMNLADLGYTGEQNDAARKTLAPITYDDSGNVIPLSERFNPEKNDIRYSVSEVEQKERAKGWLHSVGDKLAKGLHLKGDKIMLEEDAKDPSRDINLKQAYLASPSRVAEKVKTFRVLYTMADRALNKVVSLRDGFERKLNRSLALVKGKDDRRALFDLLLRGDAEGREWTRQELVDDGVKENVADAYIGIRRQLNRAYHLVNDARRKPTPKSETVDKARLDFLQANKFVTDLSVTDKGNGKYLVSYKEYKNYPKQYKEITADMVERFRRDPGIQLVEVKEAKTESGHAITDADGKPLYDVTTTEGPAELNKLTGYIPHFFHEYFLRVVDSDGHTRTIGSARNQREAVMKAEAWMKENKLADGETIHVQPKTFDINKALGVTDGDFAPVMGDKDFLRVQQNLAKQNDMTLAEAKDMLDGAVRLKGRHRFFGNAMHRTGAAGFETDLDWALRHYFNSASRYVAMETEFKPKAISYFERVFGAFDNDYDNNLLAKYCKDYINDINGNPSSLEQAISKALNSTWLFKKVLIPTFGDRAALTLGNGVANKISYLTLGLNMSSALLNFTQLMNSAAYIGDVSSLVKMLAKGSHHTYSLGELRILKETGVLNDIGIDSGSGYDKLRSGGTPTLGTGRIARTLTGLNRGVDFLGNKSMFFFQQADAICRRGTVLAAYEKARSEGKTHAEAIAFAKDVNNKANFQYGVQDAPNIFRRGSIISQMVLQFKKYGFKELEVMADFSPWSKKTSRKQKLMFWGMYALLCGAMGVPALDWLDEIFGEKTGFYTKDELQKAIIHLCGGNKRLATVFMYGLPAALNINLSSRAGLSDVIPTSLGDFAGPALSKSVRLAQDTLGGDWANALRDVNPGLYNLYAAGMGESRGKRGRLNDRYTTLWDRALRAVGFRSVDETVPTDMQRIISRDKAKLTKEKQEAQDAYIENPTSENKQRLKDLGVSEKTVQKEAEKKNQTREERTQGTVPKKEKERYQTLTDFMKE